MRPQRRGQVIAMSIGELDSFLGEQRTCRLATVGPGGPHVAPVWFAWDGRALWIYSLTRSQRWANVSRDPRVAAVVDAGHHYHELRGVEIEGQAAVVGPVPRTGEEGEAAAELAEPERLMAAKYFGPASLAASGGGGQLGRLRRRVGDDPRRPARLAPRHPAEDGQLGLPQARRPPRRLLSPDPPSPDPRC
jgi:PPOX class probable F420-dependent enzyme